MSFVYTGTLLHEVHLEHHAAPELDWDELQISSLLFGKTLRAPLLIGAMTGGTEEAGRMNAALAEVAEDLGIGFALGSQKAMSVLPETHATFDVRRYAPNALVLGNLGAVYARDIGVEATVALVRQVGADALNLHLNPAMELVQRGGDRDFRGVLDAMSATAEAGLTVIAKETGSGIGHAAAAALSAHGIKHVDVSGAGGTSWTRVESLLAAKLGDEISAELGDTFRDWGIPTAASLLCVKRNQFDTVIATGGIRTGLDAARAIALGAHAVSIARPVLLAYRQGGAAGAKAYLERVMRELRVAMLLSGFATLEALRNSKPRLGPRLREWTSQELER